MVKTPLCVFGRVILWFWFTGGWGLTQKAEQNSYLKLFRTLNMIIASDRYVEYIHIYICYGDSQWTIFSHMVLHQKKISQIMHEVRIKKTPVALNLLHIFCLTLARLFLFKIFGNQNKKPWRFFFSPQLSNSQFVHVVSQVWSNTHSPTGATLHSWSINK